ncbi:MAG: DUF58 domain-containing protein [Chthonomonadales bacterium]
MQQYKRWVIITAAIFLLTSATLINTINLYYMATLLFILPAVSYGIGMVSLRGLEVTRSTPASAWEGEEVSFRVTARTTGRLPKLFLEFEDAFPDYLYSTHECPIGFQVTPGRDTLVDYKVTCEKRGIFELKKLVVTAQDPLGIYSFSKSFPLISEVMVYPNPQPIPDILMTGTERYGVREMPVANMRGSGVDPDGVREYVPGDSLRRVHWKSTARTGKLRVIEYEESRSVNVIIAVDLTKDSNVGEGVNSSLEYLVTMAASVSQQALRQGASVRLALGDVEGAAMQFGRGTDHLYNILAALARCEDKDKVSFAERIRAKAGHIPPGTTLLILTAKSDENTVQAISEYSATGTYVVVVYADPDSFEHNSNKSMSPFVEKCAGVGTEIYVLRQNEDRAILPEGFRYGAS